MKRKFVLYILGLVGLVTIFYGTIAYQILERVSAVSLVPCLPGTVGSRPADVIGDSNPTRRSAGAGAAGDVDARLVLRELGGFNEIGVDELGNMSVVNTVHYVWCGNRTFGFVNYLSVLSAWKMLQPDSIEFHVEHSVGVDKYNTWIDRVRRTIPGFVVRKMPGSWDGSEKGCGFWFGLAVLEDRGGIYVGDNVLLGPRVHGYRRVPLSVFYSTQATVAGQTNLVSLALAKDHVMNLRYFRSKFDEKFKDASNPIFCQKLDSNLIVDNTSDCFVMPPSLLPRDIFQLHSWFGNISRALMYGSEQVKQARSFLPGKIPKIVHYVWFGEKEMDFMMYLSMLSALFILDPEKVVVYTDGHLHGRYVQRIRRDRRVVFVQRERPGFMFGHPVVYTQHRSDVVRADALLKHGGIYTDWDVLWLKNPHDVINAGYDVVANFDHMVNGGFPNMINLGVLMAKPKATFIKKWQDALVDYKSQDFLYNAVQLPYKIYEQFPEHVHIERHLQVMCFHLKCHPTFHPKYRDYNSDQPFDWRSDAFSIHFTYPDPPELQSEETCRNSTGRFADIGRFIMQHDHKLN